MVARRLIHTLVFLHYAAWSGATVLTPPDIPMQPIIRTIYGWGDQIAVITEKWMPTEKRLTYELSVVDQSTSRVVPIRTPRCDDYHDVAYGAGLGKLLLCGTGKSARVYRMSGTSWSTVSESVQGTEFRFAVDGDRIAVVSENTIFLMSASSNVQAVSIPIRIKMPPRSLPSALLLSNDLLLMAYDNGEFGGGLYRMDLKRPEKVPTKVIDANVQALARTKSGVIWAAGGLSHLRSVSGSLYRVDSNGVEVVAAISGFGGGPRGERIEKKSGAQFPGLTNVSGLALGKEDRPTVVLPAFGVFEFSREGFVALYKGPLSFYYKMPGYGVGSDPVGLATGKSGDIYVASRSLGIFVLRKNNNRYNLEQLLFDDPAHDKPLNPTR